MDTICFKRTGRSIKKDEQRAKPEMIEAPEVVPAYLLSTQETPCLLSGSLTRFLKLPEYLDLNEWLATHAYEFFHLINAYYGVVSQVCTVESCPIMRIRTSQGLGALIWPPDFVVSSKDGHSSKSSLTTMFFSASNTLCREISAANYIDSALTWIETQLENSDRLPKSISKNISSDC